MISDRTPSYTDFSVGLVRRHSARPGKPFHNRAAYLPARPKNTASSSDAFDTWPWATKQFAAFRQKVEQVDSPRMRRNDSGTARV